MELSGQSDMQIVVNSSLPNRFLDGFPAPSQFAADKLTLYSSKPQRPSDSLRPGLRILLSEDIHPNPGPTTKYSCPVGWANGAIDVLVVYIQSVLIFKMQWSTDELRTCCAALSVPHPLYRNHNRYHHQFQHKLSMGIISPSCNSTQMASETNWRNYVNS